MPFHDKLYSINGATNSVLLCDDGGGIKKKITEDTHFYNNYINLLGLINRINKI